ncbi:MAG: DNA polymerase I [Desulfovibrio sp.]|jgi:DNA polymerase-1|nr:DNA polymerase I [Desulfovibrio sp.]
MTLKERLQLADDPVFLMDGSALLYRGFFANQHLRRSDGFPTGALLLLARILLRILREERPQYLLFVLDGKGRNFRHEIYPLYKANRDATPENLVAQIEPAKRMVRALGLSLKVSEGCEADDCIASLAARFSPEHPVIIASGDKDLKQCLSPSVFIWDPAGKGEKLVSEKEFTAGSGVAPAQWPDVQALIGDASDNIPGVPGIGPAAARKIFADCRTLEDIRDNPARLPAKFQDKIKEHLDRAFVWRKLTTLSRSVCEDVRLADLAVRSFDIPEFRDITEEFELASLRREMESLLRSQKIRPEKAGMEGSGSGAVRQPPGAAPQQGRLSLFDALPVEPSSPAGADVDPVSPGAALRRELSLLESVKKPAVGEWRSVRDLPDCAGRVVALIAEAAAGKGTSLIIGVGDGQKGAGMRECAWAGEMNSLFSWLAGARQVVCADLKALLRAGLRSAGGIKPQRPREAEIHLVENSFDLGLADWLTEPDESDYSWPRLAARLGGGTRETNPSALAFGMAGTLRRRLAQNGLETLYTEMELPLTPVLADMEERGVAIDLAAFREFLLDVQKEIDSLSARIYAASGMRFNLRSARQTGEILFDRLGLPAPRKTRGGQASTSQETLEKLAGRHAVIDLILQYRKFEKMRSTYLEPLPRLIDASGRLHTTFNQKGTATGRLSSSNPNLQNIPVRGDLGKRMRACFVARPGHALVSADYSQIELRVLAHMSQDATLLAAFRNNEDIHTRTAALMYDIPPEKVGPDERRNAKTVNFGLIYGMGAQKLARELNIRAPEAKAFMERYFSRLTGLKAFFDSVESDARKQGFVATLSGRRRFLPDIHSANGQAFALARRQAVNTVIQGSAADIIKLSMLAVARDEELERVGARLTLQVHDELVLEVPAKNARAAATRTAELMSRVAPGGSNLAVPLVVDWGFGSNWGEAH